jgi:hypothetical protein
MWGRGRERTDSKVSGQGGGKHQRRKGPAYVTKSGERTLQKSEYESAALLDELRCSAKGEQGVPDSLGRIVSAVLPCRDFHVDFFFFF